MRQKVQGEGEPITYIRRCAIHFQSHTERTWDVPAERSGWLILIVIAIHKESRYDIEFFSRSVRQTTYLGSRLAVDNLPGSRLVNAESSEITDFKVNCKNNLCVDQTTYKVQTTSKKSRRLPRSSDDFVRRLLGSSDDFQTTLQEVQTTLQEVQTTLPEDFQEVQTTSRRLTVRTLYNKKFSNEEKSDIKTYQNAQIYYERETSSEDFHEVQTTSWKSRRLPGSPDDFLEVQTTSWKSRRLPGSPDDFVRRLPRSPDDFVRRLPGSPDDFQTTSRRLTGKSSKKSSRSEKPAYQIQI
ncbi:hypothetical protein YC2023_055562 [Brassica napus]